MIDQDDTATGSITLSEELRQHPDSSIAFQNFKRSRKVMRPRKPKSRDAYVKYFTTGALEGHNDHRRVSTVKYLKCNKLKDFHL